MKRLMVRLPILLMMLMAMGADEKKKEKAPAIEIQAMKFVPAELKIKVGETVTWTNDDDRDHSVVSDDGKSFMSGNIKRGKTFEQKFIKAGKYPYSCSYHPRMKGMVIVSDQPSG